MDFNELLDFNKPFVSRVFPHEVIRLMANLDDAIRVTDSMIKRGHGDTSLQVMNFVAYHGEWVRINVEKDLTDELSDAQMQDITPADVAPLFDSMEFVFQDDRYPRLLFFVKRPEYLAIINQRLKLGTVESEHSSAYCITYYMRDGVAHMLNLPPEALTGWLRGDIELPVLPGCEADTEQTDYQRQLFKMIIKIMLYASIPQYKPAEVGVDNRGMTRSEKGAFGAPTPHCKQAFIVRPPIVKLRDLHGYVAPGRGVKCPHRRVGHFKKLVSDRFTNKRGQLVYHRPCYIHGGTVSDHIYEIRKRGEDGRDGGLQKTAGTGT